MIEKIIERLRQIGYDAKNDDRSLIIGEYEKVSAFIKSSCNVEKLSDELETVIIERACGNFLFVLKNFGRFDEICGEPFVKEILEGDVKVVFDENSILSDEQKIDKIIDYLMGYGEEIIISNRCICW